MFETGPHSSAMPPHDSSSKEKEYFHAAFSLSDLARADYLDVACRDNHGLRQRVESLLAAADGGGGFMRKQAIDSVGGRSESGRRTGSYQETVLSGEDETTTTSADSLAGHTLGHYRLESLIGSGGMGHVYLAVDTRLGRKVALKVIAAGRFRQGRSLFSHEARLASALDHLHVCAIYDIGESGGWCFIAMQYIEGQTLRALIADRPVPLATLLRLAIQVADALSTAHQRGIIHRDIKPRNIMVTPRGESKVLDFGIAKLLTAESPDASRHEGLVGTPAYMSPEQARSEHVDCRSDIFSFAAVLYHMATGSAPFTGASTFELMSRVISERHLPLCDVNSDVPRKLAAVIDRGLAKAPDDRYQSMEEMAEDLRAISARMLLRKTPVLVGWRGPSRFLIAAAAVSLMATLSWIGWHAAVERWATQQVSAIEKLTSEGRTFEAYDLAVRVGKYLPNDPKLMRLIPAIYNTLSVKSEPAGARVYLKRFLQNPARPSSLREPVGTTPLVDLQIARGDYLISIEKDGYIPFQRTLSGAMVRGLDALFVPSPIEVKLERDEEAQSGMVLVPRGNCRLTAWSRPTERKVELDSYWIDQCEVTNGEYLEFVDAGGYSIKQYWTQPFVRAGRSISWEEALREMRDATGRPGPRGWTHGTFAKGKEDHPVTGITWYEAAAYANFRGKSLPTVFQWEKAAKYQWQQTGSFNPVGMTMPWGLLQGSTLGRANFSSSGTVPAGSLEFGISPVGCRDMAGNVSEWCLNETSKGFITGGGSWDSPTYLFGYYGRYPGWFSSVSLGFRCVLNSSESAGGQGGFYIDESQQAPEYVPEPEERVRTWLALYDYPKSPLDARIVEAMETEKWRREKISFNGADGERAFAYFYSPKHVAGPHQVIHIVPAGDVWILKRPLQESIEGEYGPLLEAGRAVFSVVLRGFHDREQAEGTTPDPGRIEFVEAEAHDIVDLRRGLDYLETRDDVDASRVAFLQGSAGGIIMTLPAIDIRYSAVILWGAGLRKYDAVVHAAANPIHFAPLIRQPKLLIHGLYDEASPLDTVAEPLFRVLTEPKQIRTYNGGHRPDPKYLAREVSAWLDETFGTAMQHR